MNGQFSADMVGKAINISTLAPGVLPTQLRNVKILSLLDPGTARDLTDILSRHAAVSPYLTGWKPDRYNDQNYLKIELSNGTVEYYGTSWLDFETIEYITDDVTDIRLGSISREDMNRLRRVLIKAGFEDIRWIKKADAANE